MQPPAPNTAVLPAVLTPPLATLPCFASVWLQFSCGSFSFILNSSERLELLLFSSNSTCHHIIKLAP
jgi:hypothetical protein